MERIALLPGGFKPPHAGHYNMAIWLSQNTDAEIILVKVGSKERDGITREISLQLWDLFLKNDPNSNSQKIKAVASNSNSPVQDVYDFVENEAPGESTIYLGMGEKDINDARFKNIHKFAEPKGIKFETVLVPPQAGGVSGTKMREFIKNDDKKSFQQYIPEFLTDEQKDRAWELVTGLKEDFYDPRNKYYDFAKSSEWKAGYRGKKDIPRKGDQIHNRQKNPHAHMSEGSQGKTLHVYDFDDTVARVKANIKTTITSPKGDYNKEILIPAANFPEKSKELEARLGNLKIKYDFSEFEKQIGDAIVNSKVINKLKDSLSKPDIKTTILTARSIGHPVTRYLKSIGLDAYVVPLGLQVDGKVTGQDKANWIENHIKKGYQTIYFIDDSEENRTAVAALKDKHPDVNLTVEDPAAVREMMGTMNKQEKAKHAKNLKRLKKDTDKQGDQYMEVPDYIKGTLKRKMVKKENALTKGWWKEQIAEVLTETKANTHLTHLEELVLTQGQDGYNQAKAFLYELIKNLKGEDNSIKNVSVKWDGAPAIFTGINPDNGKFFVGTKSVFNVNPKINYTSQDIDTNHGHAAGLAKKLKLALQYLPAVGIKGILQGDFMFDSDDVETEDIDGVTHYTFKPNTIRYAVEANSKLGKQVIAANIGIIFHTTYNDLSGGGASFGADISGLSKTPSVWFDDAYFKDTTGILLSDEEEKFVLDKIETAESIEVDYNSLPTEISSNAKTNLLNTYLNQEIRKGEFITDPNKSFEMFKEWYQSKIEKAVAKISPKNQDKKRKQLEDKLKTFESKKDIVINLFKVSKLLSQAKNIFIAKYDKAVATKHFIDNGDGTLSVTKAEGFVAVDHTESGIKLVDRLEFSKNNFNAGKPGAKK